MTSPAGVVRRPHGWRRRRQPAPAPLRAAALALGGLLLAGGCSRIQTDPTRPQAEEIGFRMANAQTQDPMALARLAEGRGAEVLEARDVSPCEVAGTHTQCATLLIRIEVEEPGWPAGAEPEVVRHCYRYTVRNSRHDPEPDGVDCPDGARPIDVPPAEPAPHLPDGIDDQLTFTLSALVEAGTADASSVRAAAEAVSGGPPARVDVATEAGSVGVAIGIPGEDECIAGRIVDGATVEVWRVPRVLAQPGELGCDATFAAVGEGRRAPH